MTTPNLTTALHRRLTAPLNASPQASCRTWDSRPVCLAQPQGASNRYTGRLSHFSELMGRRFGLRAPCGRNLHIQPRGERRWLPPRVVRSMLQTEFSSFVCIGLIRSIRLSKRATLSCLRLSCGSWSRLGSTLGRLGPPPIIDGRIDQPFHNGGSDHPAEHGSGDAFHYVSSGTVTPENRQQAGNDHGCRHRFRTNALYGAVVDGVTQVTQAAHPPFLLPLRVAQVEIQQHNDAGLGVQSRQRDQTDPDGDTEIVMEQVKNPDS